MEFTSRLLRDSILYPLTQRDCNSSNINIAQA